MAKANTVDTLDAAERLSSKTRERVDALRWVLFSFKGRIDRRSYTWAAVGLYGVPLLAYVLIQNLGQLGSPITSPLSLDRSATLARDLAFGDLTLGGVGELFAVSLYIWIGLAVNLKRLHDFGSGLGVLIILGVVTVIPLVGPLAALGIMYSSGHPRANKYGPGPGWRNHPEASSSGD